MLPIVIIGQQVCCGRLAIESSAGASIRRIIPYTIYGYCAKKGRVSNPTLSL